MIKRALLSFALILWAFSGVFAYDFSAPNSGGTMIYYNLNPALKAATVTYKTLAEATPDYTGKVVIPGEVRYEGTVYRVVSIGDSAFYRCAGMSGVEIPSSVDSIHKKAFWKSGLTELVIPSTVKSVRADAFFYCSKLKKVFIEDSPDPMRLYWEDNSIYPSFHRCPVETIYYGRELNCNLFPAFDEITTLKKLTFGNYVTSIPGFRLCVGLTEVVIPNSVVSVGTFARCSGLTKVVILSNSISEIISGAFEKCESLKELKIPDAVRYIGWYAFSGCVRLKELRLPSEVSFIGERAFMNTSLKSFVLPDSLRIISRKTFKGCGDLTEVLIPSLVDSVGDEAFSECSRLREMRIMNPIPPKCGEDVFWYSSRPDLYVPEGSASLYASHPVWGRLGYINEIPSGVQGLDSDPDVSVIATKEGMRIVGCRDNDLVTIYSIGGQLLYRSVVGDGRIRFSLAKGTPYIVRTAGKSFKVQY